MTRVVVLCVMSEKRVSGSWFREKSFVYLTYIIDSLY